MRLALLSTLPLFLQCMLLWEPALGQGAYSDPSDDIDSDSVLGFIVIAAVALGYWQWKRRRRSDTQSGAAAQQPPRSATSPPTRLREAFFPDTTRDAPTASWREMSEATESVFISYRRGDAGDVVGRIYDRLVERFGKPHVFKDVDSIPLGVDFRKHLSDSVGKCSVLLAIISRGWLQQADGERRIDQSNDFVRIEMEAALQRNIPVIPVLVQGASLPSESELPQTLRELAYRNATVVRPDPDFHGDIARLLDGIAFHLDPEKVKGTQPN